MEGKNALISAISSMFYAKAYPEAEQMVANSFESAYSWMKKGGFGAQTRFQEMYPAVVQRTGIVDAWLALTFLSIFSQGIAVSAGRDTVEPQDVKLAITKACEIWPECAEMRVERLIQALQHIISWYDDTFKGKEHII